MPVQGSELHGLSAWDLFGLMAAGVVPSDRKTVSQYAAEHRVISAAGGGTPQRWSNDRTPYLVEPMDLLTARVHQTLAVVGPGQVGKNQIAENWLLHSVATDPANFLWYMQADDALEAYVKNRINSMMDDHDVMQRAKGPRPIDDSLHFKKFRGMAVEYLTATMSNLISKNAPRIVADEIDAWKKLFGNVKNLLDIRRQVYGDDSMLLAMSHPDAADGMDEKKWTRGIMAMFADSTRCMWYWPCIHCGSWSSPCPKAHRYMPLEWPKDGTLQEVAEGAYLACPSGNGCVINERDRLEMIRRATGAWIGLGQEMEPSGRIIGARAHHHTGGYWIVGPMSPFVMGGIGELAKNRVAAERALEADGEDATLRQVVCKQFGFPYERGRRIGSVEANDLADRAEADLLVDTIPEGVRFFTVAVDVQLNSFVWMRRGWGVDGESWVLSRGEVKSVDPCNNPGDWDALLPILFERLPLVDGSGRTMAPRAVAFDSAGAPGVTEQAYSAWKRWRGQKKITLFGKLAGREVWSVLPLKGAPGLNAPRLVISYPDTARKASKVAGKGEVPIGIFNPNVFKDALGGQLLQAEPGPGYIHFPHSFRAKESPHPFFEQVVAEQQLPNGRWEKVNAGARNENLDLLVMNHVIAHLQGLSRINWNKPPPWAAPWSTNVSIFKPGAVTPTGAKIPPARQEKDGPKVTIDRGGKKNIGSRIA